MPLRPAVSSGAKAARLARRALLVRQGGSGPSRPRGDLPRRRGARPPGVLSWAATLPPARRPRRGHRRHRAPPPLPGRWPRPRSPARWPRRPRPPRRLSAAFTSRSSRWRSMRPRSPCILAEVSALNDCHLGVRVVSRLAGLAVNCQHGHHQREGGTGDHQVCMGQVPAGGGHQPSPEQGDQGEGGHQTGQADRLTGG